MPSAVPSAIDSLSPDQVRLLRRLLVSRQWEAVRVSEAVAMPLVRLGLIVLFEDRTTTLFHIAHDYRALRPGSPLPPWAHAVLSDRLAPA